MNADVADKNTAPHTVSDRVWNGIEYGKVVKSTSSICSAQGCIGDFIESIRVCIWWMFMTFLLLTASWLCSCNEAAFCPPLAPISCRLMKAKRARNEQNEPMWANVYHRLDNVLGYAKVTPCCHMALWHDFFSHRWQLCSNAQMLQHGKVLKERFFSRSLRCCQ